MTDEKYVLGVDVGGTKVLACLTDLSGNVVREKEVATDAHRGPDAVIQTMVDTAREVLREERASLSDLLGVGVSSAGACDTRAGVVLLSPNLPGWTDVPLARQMSQGLGVQVYLGNDATLAALGEHTFGAGRGVADMLYITVSTGIGGGIVIGGRMYEGVNGTAGEIGHVVVDLHGPLCTCGQRGCLEAFSAGWALAQRGRDLASWGRAPKLLALVGGDVQRIAAKEVFQAADQGDVLCRAVVEEGRYALGMGLVNLLNLFNPAMIVVGGGVSRRWDDYIAPAVAVMRERACYRVPAEAVRVVPAVLGSRVCVLGAVALVLQEKGVGR
jgi:glucokinase